MNLKGKHFLKLLDFTPEEIEGLIDLAADLKAKKKAGIAHDTVVPFAREQLEEKA